MTPGLFEIEARYLVEQEWATTADDILWRRTKLGLHANADSQQRLATWLGDERGAQQAARKRLAI